MHLAGRDLEIDAVERAYARERLDDAGQPQARRRVAVITAAWPPYARSLASTRGADDAGPRAELGQHDRQVAGGQRQRPPVDDAADLGQQQVPEPGQPAADDDHRRVDEADQPGEHACRPGGRRRGSAGCRSASPSAAPSATSAAVTVPLAASRSASAGDVPDRAAASASRASAAPLNSASRQPTLPHEHTGPCVVDLDVPDVAGAAVGAAVDLAAEVDAAADAGADLDEQQVVDRVARRRRSARRPP